jgi:hypothetical protein
MKSLSTIALILSLATLSAGKKKSKNMFESDLAVVNMHIPEWENEIKESDYLSMIYVFDSTQDKST